MKGNHNMRCTGAGDDRFYTTGNPKATQRDQLELTPLVPGLAQQRLQPYLDEIDLTLTADGSIAMDFGGMEARLDAVNDSHYRCAA